MKIASEFIIEQLDILFPDAHCELKHDDNFQLLIAVILSAQTTDLRVNMVTPNLFARYHNAEQLAKANLNEVEEIIKSIGLYKNKARNIIECAKVLVKDYNTIVPSQRTALESLPGVGRKTCNVILSNCFDVPAFAVDTHVARVSKRLRIAKKDDDVLTIEKKLMKYFPKDSWNKLHHQFIFFGRYKCKAKAPLCSDCPFASSCDKAF